MDTYCKKELNVGAKVKISNVIPEGYNGTYTVTDIVDSKTFIFNLPTNPGTFANNTSIRDLNLPYFQPKETANTYKLYKIETIQDYIPEKQDGIYELIILNNSISPIAVPFNNIKLSQPIKNLYPQIDRDNSISDPEEAISFAKLDNIGEVTVNDSKNSITKETLNTFLYDFNVGFGVTAIVSNSVGTSHTIYTDIDHGLSEITALSIVSVGSSYIPGTYYGVDLQGSTTGINAKVAIEVDATGNVDSVQIMDGGSHYVVGNTLSLIPPVGIGTTTGFVPATVGVTSISYNVGDVITLSGYTGINTGYNSLYRITSIPTNNRVIVASAGSITNFNTAFVTTNSTAVITGKSLTISGFTYDRIVGIATVTTSSAHDLNLNQKLRFSGFTQSFYNKDASVSKVISSTLFEVVGIGTSTTTPATTGTRIIYPYGYNTSQSGNNRGRYIYDKVVLSNSVQLLSTSPDATPMVIVDAQSSGLKLGDYIEVNGEVMRVRSPITNNNVFVYRAQLGTIRKIHPVGSIVQRIKPIPVEFRRNTIIRASGHTFEYVGFGPGNYSTAFPEKQDRKLSESERILSQASKYNGGVVYYSGTDDSGDFYAGNKKTTSATGKEEIFDTPIQTFTGDENITNEIVKTNDIIVDRSIRIGGGKNNDVTSEFNGPVILNEKLTSYSPEGIEASSMFLQGDLEISRRYSISSDIPTVSGNYGDVIYRASPNEGENIGWVYTTSDRWRTWGYVGDLGTLVYLYSGTENGPNVLEGIVDKIKFVGDPNGFGIDVDIEIDPTVGFGTIVLRNPIDIINFGTGILGIDTPRFTTRSVGSRLVYNTTLNTTNVDYATGVSDNILWNSVPRNVNSLFFKWYGGETEIASLSGTGNLILSGSITTPGGLIGNLTGDVTGNVTGSLSGNATSANLIKTQLRQTDASHFLTFVDSNNTTATNENLYTDAGITYNPSTNILTTNLSGNATSANLIKTQLRQTDASHFLTFVDSNNTTATNENLYTDAGITYNPSTNILTTNLSGNAETATTAANLTRSVIAGDGLTGGGSLNNQNVTLDIVGATNGGIQVNANSIQVDTSVVRITGNQDIGGTKTFNENVTVSSTTPTGSVILQNDGHIELWRNTGPYIDFKASSTNDYRIRLSNFNTNTNTERALTITSDPATTWAANLRVEGDITAFVSDIRLKENIQNIENPLDKVLSLNGFTYTFNETAQKLGLSGDKTHIGVSAQEVQRVAPEAIQISAISDKSDIDYLTVQYEKLVPLLIEAIKEQNEKIEKLEQRIQQLGG
jgi:hypothetical protein